MRHPHEEQQQQAVADVARLRAPIAIIGMAGRFPGARNVQELWKNLLGGVDSITRFSEADLDPDIDAATRHSPRYVPARGIFDDADKLDAAFFGIKPAEATLMDPQHRVFLEVSWSALENAGYTPEGYTGRIGVFGGVAQNTYYSTKILERPDIVDRVGAFHVMVLNDKDYVATRTAYELDLRGPAINVQTACSTSLVAVYEAVRSLRAGDCDMAIAGGVAITVPVRSGHLYQEGSMLSRDGRCRPFDASGTGTMFGDGAALVVLKRLDDAVADGDTIYAVVRGVGVSNDGSRKQSFTAPSVDGQAAAIENALNDGGVSARSISYVEAHGPATPVGDPIEVEALTKAFRATTDDRGFCALGSIKSNVGHLVAAAGTTGLIKTALSMFHRQLPATLHFTQPNPNIDFASSPFFVQAELAPWRSDQPLRAGVSSFGVGGTNAHVVLEQAPKQRPGSASRPAQLLLVSARSPHALETAKLELAEHLRATDVEIADVAHTLQVGRRAFCHRSAVVASSREDGAAKLVSLAAEARAALAMPAHLAFMFPGQGSQYVGMGSGLYRIEPGFRAIVDACTKILEPHLGCDLRDVMFAAEDDRRAAELLRATQLTQPALFVLEYALSELWRSWGVVPEAMIGHSVGEFVCAALAGVMSLEDALRLVAERGKLLQALPPGSMLSVRLPADRVRTRLRHRELAIASINGPMLCVVAGPSELVGELERELTAEGTACRPLHTSHAFHSPMVEPAIEPFATLVSKISLREPSIPFVSSVTGRFIEPHEATSPMYWARHMQDCVLFSDGVRTMWSTSGRVLLEVGPRKTLATLARQQVSDRASQVAVSSLGETADGDAEYTAMLHAAGQLWMAGIAPSWSALQAGDRRTRVPLPTYPFERQRYWVDSPPRSKAERGEMPVAVAAAPPPTIAKAPDPVVTSARLDSISMTLRQLIEGSSGVDINASDAHTSFVELGLDSLFLTQIALTIEKHFSVQTTMLQLLDDHPTLAALAEHLAAHAPQPAAVPATPIAPPAPPSVVRVEPESPAVEVVPPPAVEPEFRVGVESLVERQLAVMERQLELLGATRSPRSSSPAPQRLRPAEVAEPPKMFGAGARISLGGNDGLTPKQQEALDSLARRYNARTQRSKSFAEAHRGVMADPRVVTGFRPALKEMVYPIVVARSLGSRLWDLDGNEYIDVLCGFGSNYFGWSPPFIVEALRAQLERGFELGPQHPLTSEVAQLICELTGLDRAAFCNTGSEAVLAALRISRTVTGRRMIASFSDSYHGVSDEMIVRAAKRGAIPAAPGIMPSTAENIMVLDYGTPQALEILRAHANELAAVIVEPVQNRRPDVQPRAFLHEVRELTAASETALIFDEVVTGFRIAPGGAQEYFGVQADLATYGKVIGGGMPIGVVAGSRRFMDALDGGAWQFGDASKPTVGVTYFAGTFVRHPLALAAAKASLLHLKERGSSLQRSCNARTERLASTLNRHFAGAGAPIAIKHFGSIWRTTFVGNQPLGELLFVLLRERGIHILDGFSSFIGEAHTDADVDFIVAAFEEAVAEMQASNFLTRA